MSGPMETAGPRLRLDSVLLLVGILVALGFVGCMLSQTDGHFVPQSVDLYVVLQYAKAMAEGHPFQYNVGDAPTSGSTSLLHTALLAVGHGAGVRGEWLVALAVLIGAVLYVASIFRARRVGEALAGPREGVLAASLVAFGGPIVWGFLYGSDIALYMFLALWLLEGWLDLWRRGSGRAFAVSGSLLALARPEALVTVTCLGAAGFWHRRRAGPATERFVPLVPVASALFALALQKAFVGSWLGTSVSGKSLLPNYGFWDSLGVSAQYGVDVVRGLLLGFYPPDAAIGFSRGYASLQFPPLGLAFILVCLACAAPAHRRALAAWLAVVALLFALVGPNLFMGVQFNRYLMWAFPGLLCLVAAGLGEATRLLSRGQPDQERTLFLVGAGLFVALGILATVRMADLYGQMAGDTYRREVPTAAWIVKNLPPGTEIANVATSVEYLTGHRNLNLHGVTSPEFVGNRLVEKEAGMYEALVRFPAARRPPYLLVNRSAFEAWKLYRELVDGPPLFVSSSFGDDLLIFRARYDLVGRGAEPQAAEARSAVAGLTRVDALNVCDARDEADHGYDYTSRRGALRLAGGLEIDEYPGGLRVADAGRPILGGETFRVKTTPGRDLLMLRRSRASLEGRSMAANGPASHVVGFNEEGFAVQVDGTLAERVSFRPGPGWSEVLVRIRGPLVRNPTTTLELSGRYTSFQYWFFQ